MGPFLPGRRALGFFSWGFKGNRFSVLPPMGSLGIRFGEAGAGPTLVAAQQGGGCSGSLSLGPVASPFGLAETGAPDPCKCGAEAGPGPALALDAAKWVHEEPEQ